MHKTPNGKGKQKVILPHILNLNVDKVWNVSDFGFGLISVLWPFDTFYVISVAVNYPNHTVPGQDS